jgi:molybdenum cofactor cytidylyltransferase
MVRHAAETLLAANLENSVIITGHESHNVSQALDGLKVTHVTCPSYALGLSETIKRGISSLPEGVDAILIALGDMPRLSVTTINRLISAFDPHQGRSICVPVYQGKRGTPVLFSSRFFPEILELSGDAGAKSLLHDYREFVAEIPVDDPGIHLDIDTPDELETERRKG